MPDSDAHAVARWGKVRAWWLHHPDVTADHFCVLSALATYADANGACEPSQATLARWLQRSRPWVNRVIAELVAFGLLTKEARTRRNGGTTSCLYRLASEPQEAERQRAAAGVTGGTPPVAAQDTPRHQGDTNQPEPEQIQNTPPAAPAPASHSNAAPEPLPADWQPSGDAVHRAIALYPDANITEHTALFVSRCRGKGYAIRPGGADDLWLSWLIQDNRQAGTHSRQRSSARESRQPKQDAISGRFAAWGLAAAHASLGTRTGGAHAH